MSSPIPLHSICPGVPADHAAHVSSPSHIWAARPGHAIQTKQLTKHQPKKLKKNPLTAAAAVNYQDQSACSRGGSCAVQRDSRHSPPASHLQSHTRTTTIHPQSKVFLSVLASSDSARYPPQATTTTVVPGPVALAAVVAGLNAAGGDDRQLCPYVDGAV